MKKERARLEKKMIVQSIETHLMFLKEEIKKIEVEIREILDKQTGKIKEILISEKRIGEQTAVILIASLLELGKLENRQIAELVGLAPMAHDSGKTCLKCPSHGFYKRSQQRFRNFTRISETKENLHTSLSLPSPIS